MSNKRELKKHLEKRFEDVRPTDKGFKFNTNLLNEIDMIHLTEDPMGGADVYAKRSGIGLVVVI